MPLDIKKWSKPPLTLVDVGKEAHIVNIDFTNDGVLRPRKTWKTFAGMVYQLWLLNKRLTRLGTRASYTVTLPLKEGGYTHVKPKKGSKR